MKFGSVPTFGFLLIITSTKIGLIIYVLSKHFKFLIKLLLYKEVIQSRKSQKFEKVSAASF